MWKMNRPDSLFLTAHLTSCKKSEILSYEKELHMERHPTPKHIISVPHLRTFHKTFLLDQ